MVMSRNDLVIRSHGGFARIYHTSLGSPIFVLERYWFRSMSARDADQHTRFNTTKEHRMNRLNQTTHGEAHEGTIHWNRFKLHAEYYPGCSLDW